MCKEIKSFCEERSNAILIVEPQLCRAAEQQISKSKTGKVPMKKLMCTEFTRTHNGGSGASNQSLGVIREVLRDVRERYLSQNYTEALREHRAVIGPVALKPFLDSKKPPVGAGLMAYAAGVPAPRIPGIERQPTHPKRDPHRTLSICEKPKDLEYEVSNPSRKPSYSGEHTHQTRNRPIFTRDPRTEDHGREPSAPQYSRTENLRNGSQPRHLSHSGKGLSRREGDLLDHRQVGAEFSRSEAPQSYAENADGPLSHTRPEMEQDYPPNSREQPSKGASRRTADRFSK